MKRIVYWVGLGAFVAVGVAMAEVPVVDLSQNVVSTTTPTNATEILMNSVQQSLSLDQRVARLERQMSNLTMMNLAARLDEMQQAIQKMQGKLDVQAHDVQSLNDQQRKFYQDMDQRINQLKNLLNGADPTAANNTTTPTTTTTLPKAQTDQTGNIYAKEKLAYQSAFDLLKARKYPGAIAAFQSYLSDYPNGSYVANSHYWIAEIYYMQGNAKQAEAAFSTIVKDYPDNQKVPDALLKLALIHIAANKTDQAIGELQKIQKSYPNTAAASLAATQLKKLGR